MKLNIGDWVRISYLKKTFDREYQEKWSGEIFKVVGRKLKQGRAVYTLQDYAGEDIVGSFYPEELQLITVPENAVYKVEKVIRSRKRKGKPREYFVKWLNWGERWNSWVTEQDLRDLPKPPE